MFDVGYNFFLENTFQHNFIRLLSTANIHYYSIKYRSNCCIKYRSNWILNDNTYKVYRWHFLHVLSDIIISELLYLCRFDMLILLSEMRCYLLPRISFRRIIVRVDIRIRTRVRYARAAALALTASSRVHASFVISVASRACSVQKSAARTPVHLSISHLASCRKINGWPM